MNNTELLANYVLVLKENGFKVYTSDSEDIPSYAYFVKNNNIGYVQCAYFGGLSFSTVHKPCKECGTGFGLNSDGIYDPTVENAEKTFINAPHWAKRQDVEAVKKYASWDEFVKRNTILKYREI